MPEPIRYIDRASGALKTERVYGESWLRHAYGNPAGRLAVWLIARRIWFSQWYGRKMKRKASALNIIPFIARYDIDVDEFAKSPFDYKSFNEFFCRALKPAARPIAPGADVAVFPADGRHLAFPDVEAAEGFYVKGQRLSVPELVMGHVRNRDETVPIPDLTHCSMLISRLCPVDYHRFHFPVAGMPAEPTLIAGWLYSVSPLALRRNLRYLVENKRKVTWIDSPEFGRVAMVEIGATNVGSIQQSFIPGQAVAKGEEKGFFSFGGSCVVTLFPPGRIIFDLDIVENSRRHLETYARMGERLGRQA